MLSALVVADAAAVLAASSCSGAGLGASSATGLRAGEMDAGLTVVWDCVERSSSSINDCFLSCDAVDGIAADRASWELKSSCDRVTGV